MAELTCIVCPRGCTMEITGEGGNLHITGNGCKRGAAFAEAEQNHPMRTICSTVETDLPEQPALPVRVSRDIPKDKIFEVMQKIKQVRVSAPVHRGDVIIQNVLGLDADIIAAGDLPYQD